MTLSDDIEELDKLYDKLPNDSNLRELVGEIVDLNIEIEKECNQ